MIKLTRRNVIKTIASGGAVTLCPSLLKAQSLNLDAWDDIPTTEPIGQTALVTLEAGPAEIDISTLKTGEVTVVARPTDDPNYSDTGMMQYVGILRRTDAQIAYGNTHDKPGSVQDSRFFVTDLLCPHRGNAIGITGSEDRPFACTDRRSRHRSEFTASGEGVAGASEGEDWLFIPDYTLEIVEDNGSIKSAILTLS
jgi:hypothetical protein